MLSLNLHKKNPLGVWSFVLILHAFHSSAKKQDIKKGVKKQKKKDVNQELTISLTFLFMGLAGFERLPVCFIPFGPSPSIFNQNIKIAFYSVASAHFDSCCVVSMRLLRSVSRLFTDQFSHIDNKIYSNELAFCFTRSALLAPEIDFQWSYCRSLICFETKFFAWLSMEKFSLRILLN